MLIQGCPLSLPFYLLMEAVNILHFLLDPLDCTFNTCQSPRIPTSRSHSAPNIFAAVGGRLGYFDTSMASTEFAELFLCVSWNIVARGSEAVSVTYGSCCDVKQSTTFLSTASQRRTGDLMNCVWRELAVLARKGERLSAFRDEQIF